jgi:proline iminopeptidase
MEDEIADIEALRQRIKTDKISLIGWSFLGALAVLYADAHPQHVARVVQIGPLPPRSDPYWPEYQHSMDSRIQALSAKNVKEHEADGGFPLRAMVQAGLGDPSIADRILAEVGTDMPNESPKALGVWFQRRLQSGNTEWDYRPHAKRMTCPVLTIHGTADNVPMAASREWATLLPNARLLVIENVGHYPFYESRETLLGVLRNFLGGK